VAQAVAITGGKIVAVGSNDVVRARIGSATQTINWRGRTATPGLIDTHPVWLMQTTDTKASQTATPSRWRKSGSPTSALKDLKCELTLFRGTVVYRSTP